MKYNASELAEWNENNMNLDGEKFGRLIIVGKIIEKRRTYCKCICECGNEIIVRFDCLKSGNTKSCGCLKREVSSITVIGNSFKHGHALAGKFTKEYRAWTNMKTRCYNSNVNNYHRYGGRGIKVCDRWLNDFEAFLNDVGFAPSPEYSIDRINNDGNYEPGNVKWSTASEQVNNRTSY